MQIDLLKNKLSVTFFYLILCVEPDNVTLFVHFTVILLVTVR